MAHDKDWKALTIDWVAMLDFDQVTTIAVCLTQREIAILKSCLIPAYWSTRWTNLSISVDQLDAFIANIDNQLSGNDCGAEIMEFRDNPADGCEVQYSTDGGSTWSTMFRKDNCIPGASADQITNIYTDIDNITTNNTTWAGDITNVAPDWAYVDTDSDKALCWAIDFYVDFICDTAISQIKSGNVQRRSENDWLDDLGEMIGASIIGALVFFSANPITLPAVYIGLIMWASTVVVEEVWDWLIGVDYEDFEDDDARSDVKCIMYQSMQGVTPQFSIWQDSLEDYALMGGAQKTIAGAVHEFNQSVDVYINYMMLMEELNDISATLPACDCPARWEHEWNFITHDADIWEIGGTPPLYGTWIDNFGFDAELNGASPESNLIQRIVSTEVPVPRCDRWAFTFTGVKGTFDSNVTSMQMLNSPQGPSTGDSGWFFGGTHEWFNYFALDTITYFSLFIRSCWTVAGSRGTVYVHNIKLGGVGVDPFIGRETS